jgi:hypothetical protein
MNIDVETPYESLSSSGFMPLLSAPAVGLDFRCHPEELAAFCQVRRISTEPSIAVPTH